MKMVNNVLKCLEYPQEKNLTRDALYLLDALLMLGSSYEQNFSK